MRVRSICICIEGGEWEDTITKQLKEGPKKDDIVIVCGFSPSGFLIFEEWPDLDWDGTPKAFDPVCFRELQPPLEIDIESIIAANSLI